VLGFRGGPIVGRFGFPGLHDPCQSEENFQVIDFVEYKSKDRRLAALSGL